MAFQIFVQPWHHNRCEVGGCDRKGRWMIDGTVYCGQHKRMKEAALGKAEVDRFDRVALRPVEDPSSAGRSSPR